VCLCYAVRSVASSKRDMPVAVVIVVAKVNISKPLVTKLLTDMVSDDPLLKLGRIMPEMDGIVKQ